MLSEEWFPGGITITCPSCWETIQTAPPNAKVYLLDAPGTDRAEVAIQCNVCSVTIYCRVPRPIALEIIEAGAPFAMKPNLNSNSARLIDKTVEKFHERLESIPSEEIFDLITKPLD